MQETQNRSTFNVLFIIKKAKLLKNGEAPICMRVTVNKQVVEILVKRSIDIKEWNQVKGCSKAKTNAGRELNHYLEVMRSRILQIHREMQQDDYLITAITLRDRFYGKDDKCKTLVEVYTEHNEKCRALIGIDYSQSTVDKFDTSLSHIKEYMRHKYGREDLLLREINSEYVTEFEFYLKKVKECQHNTTIKHLKNLKKVIRIALTNDWLKKDPFMGIQFKHTEVHPEFLTQEELTRLMDKKFAVERIGVIRDIYCFCAFTGLAFSDVKQLRTEHIISDNNGALWIRKSRQKTGNMCNIPLLSSAIAILARYKDHPKCVESGLLLPVPSNQRTNAYLKEIADLCGINKRLCTHTARHTAATTTFLANGVSMENVAKILGHSDTKWSDKQSANEIFNECQDSPNIWIKQIERAEKEECAPLLYDLTTLQKDANVRYGYTAEETLSIAQRLYELKLITYPRTGSRYITDDVFAEVSMLLRFLKNNDIHTDYIERLGRARRNCVDDREVTDHHALLITGLKIGDIAPRERNIYDMIVERMLEAFSDSCIKDVTTIKAECAGVELAAKGVTIKQIGWRAFKKEEIESVILPQFEEGETPEIKAYSLTEGKSKPKPLHTESSLLAAMQSATKDLGIGTPATRANIIETLVKRGYLTRQKRLLLPTELGLALNAVVKRMQIANVELTADWESNLLKIERGELDPSEFRKSIEEFTKEITTELLTCKKLFAVKRESEHLCPKCKTGKLRFYTKVVKCDNEECAKPFFRVIAGKTLKDSEMIELLTTGKTGVLRGFNSKQDKPFSASLELDDEFNIKFSFA